jgi:hypothetical protein
MNIWDILSGVYAWVVCIFMQAHMSFNLDKGTGFSNLVI